MNDIKKVLIVAISVVLVIAIVAGVSIGVMANTMNGLKDRVSELEQAHESEIAAMKAEIEAAKNSGENLVTAEDFEAKLAAALGDQTQTMQSLINAAVKSQIEALETEGLTEAQVNEIINAAVANCLTEADIDAIIADMDTGLTDAEVKKLINNANAGFLTYAQIMNLIDDADYDMRSYLIDYFTVELNKVIDEVNDLGGELGRLEGELGDLEDDFDYSEQSTFTIDIENKAIEIGTPRALIEWAATINEDKAVYQDYTVTLTADIDLDGHEWTPIVTYWYMYKGDVGCNLTGMVFDGDGHTISNLTVGEGVEEAGFFGVVESLTVKNVTFVKANVGSDDAVRAGVVAAQVWNSGRTVFENITVENSIVTSNGLSGGLVGYMAENDTIITDVTVTGCDITSKGSVEEDDISAAGGIIGSTKSAGYSTIHVVFAGCTYENNTYAGEHTDDLIGYIDGTGSAVEVESTDYEVVTDVTELAEAIANAEDGAAVLLKSGEYNYGSQINVNGKSIEIVGIGDNVVVNLTASNQKAFYIYGSAEEGNTGINVTIANITINGNNAKADIWVRTNSNTCRGDVNLTLDNVDCTSIMIDNNYSEGTIINVDLKNCDVDWIMPDASPFNSNGLNTYTNVTYDDASEIGSINIQNGVDDLTHITINGVKPTAKGEQLN